MVSLYEMTDIRVNASLISYSNLEIRARAVLMKGRGPERYLMSAWYDLNITTPT
jgi:hypothetical protein